MAVRILSILAAAFLVGAVALALLGPPEASLAEFLAALDRSWVTAAEMVVRHHLPNWVWDGLVIPVLIRPVWLVPTALGLVCIGLAISLTSRPGATRSRRWRS